MDKLHAGSFGHGEQVAIGGSSSPPISWQLRPVIGDRPIHRQRRVDAWQGGRQLHRPLFTRSRACAQFGRRIGHW